MNAYPNTVTYDGRALLEMKEELSTCETALSALKERAEKALDLPRISVVDRKLRAPSGNIHDYTSMGPYWWPDPDKKGGLPYIRRDGVTNPDTQESVTFWKMSGNAHLLALAALHLGDSRYAAKAVKLLRDWYLEPESYMTPHLEYGQAIPGICNGRGIGLIDLTDTHSVYNAIGILEYLDAIDAETVSGIKSWVDRFVDWMLTSETGADEDDQFNNHGSWFDVQVASAAIFTSRKRLAEKTLNAAYDRRVKRHIMSDGSQPHELARTKGMSYSIMNLDALTLLGNMSARLGLRRPYWSQEEDGGCLLRLAVDYLYPYVVSPETFPYQQIGKDNVGEAFAKLLVRADHYFPQAGYAERAASLYSTHPTWSYHPLA